MCQLKTLCMKKEGLCRRHLVSSPPEGYLGFRLHVFSNWKVGNINGDVSLLTFLLSSQLSSEHDSSQISLKLPWLQHSNLISWLTVLCFIFFTGCTMQHVGYYFPDQGSNSHPLHWKHRILTTGPSGKSLSWIIVLILSDKGLSR